MRCAARPLQPNLWCAKNASGAKTQVSISIASGSREPRRPDSGHVTLCYMVVGGNLNSPLNLFISFAKALMEQGFPSDPFLAKDKSNVIPPCRLSVANEALIPVAYGISIVYFSLSAKEFAGVDSAPTAT